MDLLRQIPPLSYTLQNILISCATVLVALFSLGITFAIFLPISCIRFLITLPFALSKKDRIKLGDQHRNILIIGASHGIGRSILEQYASEPETSIVAVSRDREALEDAKASLGSDSPAKIHVETLDIGNTSASEIQSAIKNWEGRYGPFTHVYSVAGTIVNPNEWSIKTVLEVIQTNIIGTVCCVLSAYDLMQRHGKGGCICIVGSTAGLQTPANMIIYSSTKAFLNTFAICLRYLALSPRSPLFNSPVGATTTTETEASASLSGSSVAQKARDAMKAPPIEITVLMPGFIDTRMTALLRVEGSIVPNPLFRDPIKIAHYVKNRVEDGGTGIILWPWGQGIAMWASQALNPLCNELAKWIGWKSGVATRGALT